ncbi:MAG: CRISPR-associated helicase Cas3' [Candidatus Omnitrophota bacterium]|jgi:CRISPR-associated endonuclease/helicase Cas3
MTYYARKDQTLDEHIENTANCAGKFANVFGCTNIAYTAGLLHDFGKYTRAFQDYLQRSLNGGDARRGEVIHALQGAKFALENIKDSVVADIIGNVIATHHGGLFDNIADGERTLFVKANKGEDRLHYAEAIKAFSPGINEAALKTEILNICRKSQEKRLSPHFMLHLLTKAIYSCVVDADRCNSAGINIDDAMPDWANLIQLLEAHLASFPDESEIDKVRKRISEQCQDGGRRQQGIYTLSVPTGGGKTLSSLRFALEHAKKHGLKRIIYVIPYLSILDQTAETMRCTLAECDKSIRCDLNGKERETCAAYRKTDELILEHHSNIEPLEDDDEEQYRLLTARWDSPIILTTMVQFLETIYSNKASHLRKFHNMSEAILIFDEIQTLPIKCVHLFNAAVNFLHSFGKSTILLCTATQPHLHKTERPVLLSDSPDIITITPEELKIFERVYIENVTQSEMDHAQIAVLVKTQIEQGKSTLVILNTKGDARKIYEQCKPIECEKAFLTTDLCPDHRLKILDRLRKNLDSGTKRLTLCVSTQLIEAGVDVSFDCVIRAEAGMDSIIQAAGRCNRNKEKSTPQSVFVVNVRDEKLLRLPEIKDGKDVTARVFRENPGKDLLGDEVMGLFYKYYFYSQKDKMDYSVKGGKTTIYSMLNDNPLGTVAYKNREDSNYAGLPCAFKTAADEFSVIDGGQIGIVVPYGDALQLVDAFQHCYDPKEKMRILKQLQKYTVSVYSNSLDQIKQAASIVGDAFYLLSPDYYDAQEQGLKREAMFSFLNG